MNIKTSTKKLAFVAGILGVCGLGFLAPSASARPRSTTRTTTRTTTVVRTRPVTRTTTIVRTAPVVRNRTIVTNRPVVVRPRTTVIRPRTTIVRRPINRNRYTNERSTYSGSVTYVAAGRFGINTGGRQYTVFVSSGLPRNLSRGDLVQVVGTRNGNAIQSNKIYITRNV